VVIVLKAAVQFTGCFCWMVAAAIQPVCLITMAISADKVIGGGDRGFRQVAAKAQIRAYQTALEFYQKDVGEFPTTRQGLEALRSDPGVAGWRGPYVNKDIGLDPWGHPFLYRLEDGSPEVMSLGADGVRGGEGISADISSRNLPLRHGRHVRYGWASVFAVGALGLFGYPLLPRLLRRLTAA
jgi:type II secretion system protein G